MTGCLTGQSYGRNGRNDKEIGRYHAMHFEKTPRMPQRPDFFGADERTCRWLLISFTRVPHRYLKYLSKERLRTPQSLRDLKTQRDVVVLQRECCEGVLFWAVRFAAAAK
jgi:hypothetical protein